MYQKYATVDVNSGMLYWAGFADSPEQACQEAYHAVIWTDPAFTLVDAQQAQQRAGLAVYLIPGEIDVPALNCLDDEVYKIIDKCDLVGYYASTVDLFA